MTPRIAIIGLAARLPGAPDAHRFFDLLLQGRSGLSPLPPDRWSERTYGADWPGLRPTVPQGGVLDDLSIDWKVLRLPPLQLERMHRMEKVALHTMSAALADAGIHPGDGPFPDAQVIIAASSIGPDPATDHGKRVRRFELASPVSEALLAHLPAQKAEIDEIIERLFNLAAPPIDPDSMMTSASLIAGRVANLYDFGGGHLAIDAGMASSLAALDRARDVLLSGSCDLALLCGISALITPALILAFAHRHPLAGALPRPFDPNADGTALGEGCAALVLARLEDVADRRVYACIDGIGSAALGKDKDRGGDLGAVTRDAVRGALAQAGCDPAEVGFVESRAAGEPDGDGAEWRGLCKALRPGPALVTPAPLRITSSVPNIGFQQAASGLVALVKAALSIFRGTWPGQHMAPARSEAGLQIPSAPTPWDASTRVGVSDVGMGPLAYHALLSPAPPKPDSDERPRVRSWAPLRTQAPAPPRPRPELAIVGCGLIVPRATSVRAFWDNVLVRVDAISDLPRSRWDAEKLIGASKEIGAILKTRLAGIVDLPAFDPARFGLDPAQARVLDPAVILSLLCAEQALTDAGFKPGRFAPERVSVIMGQLPLRAMEIEAEKRVLFAGHLELTTEALREVGLAEADVARLIRDTRARFDRDNLPLTPSTWDAFSGLQCAARIAAAYDLRGGALSVDAACASGLAALQLGADALLSGKTDVALCGGVAYNLLPEYYLVLGMLGFLSPRGAPPFTRDTSGFVPAEGAGLMVVRRLADALKDGDRIYATIRAIGASSDGKGTTIFVPNTQGQQRAIRRALQQAALQPAEVDLLEAHGAGTPVGDRTEAQTYAAVYGEGRDPGAPLTVGTVKTHIGHLSSAAGAVGVIKIAMALCERVLPPGAGDVPPDPSLPFGKLPIELGSEPRPWIVPWGRRRVGAVSAIGLGGVNYHVLLSDHESTTASERRVPPALRHPAPLPPRGTLADRFVPELVPLSLPSRPPLFPLRDRHVLLVGDRGPGTAGALPCALAQALRERLTGRGARVSVLPAGVAFAAEQTLREALAQIEGRGGPIDLMLDLCPFLAPAGLDEAPAATFLRAVREHVHGAFALLRFFYGRLSESRPESPATRAGYVAVTALGGGMGLLPRDGEGSVLGAAYAGLLRGVKQELPGALAKTVDLPADADPAWAADAISGEIEDGNERMEAGYVSAGRRLVVNLRREVFERDSRVMRTMGDGDVFLFSGGGRGVAFECACALARLGPRVIVTGRTEPPELGQPWLDLSEEDFGGFLKEEMLRMRQQDATLTPVRFRDQAAIWTRQRELHRNLQRVRRFGLPIEYEVCDVNDEAQVRGLLQRVHGRHGPGCVTGVGHAAMVEWSTSLPRKTRSMIDGTITTKVGGLLNLLSATEADPVRLFVSFGSGAGRFGNRGQSDYCAANSLMAALLSDRARRVERAGRHLSHVTIDWTAWRDVGAAAQSPEMAALVRATGVTAISPLEGTYWFLSEVFLGRSPEVVIFEERMLHEWPFLGRSAEGSGARGADFDDRGVPLVPGAWPMLDRQVGVGEGICFERRLDVARDVILDQHRLYGVPILPATFGCETLAEAAAQCGRGLVLEAAEDVRVEVPLKLHREAPLMLRVSAKVLSEEGDRVVVQAESRSDLRLRGAVIQKDRLHHRGRFVFRRGEAPAGRRVEISEQEGVVHARSTFHMARDPITLGPLYSRAAWIQVGDQDVIGTVRAPRQRDICKTTSYPVFQVDPLLLDAAFQVAADWDGRTCDFVSVPMGLDRLVLGRARGRGEGARVHAWVRRVADADVFYDLLVTTEGGDVVMEVSGLHMRRISRLSAGESPS